MSQVTRILVIDDSEDDRLLYRRALRKITHAQYEMIEADNGDDGLALADAGGIDCVLLDYSLPGRNGVEVLRRLRAKHAFVPVVMLTGQGNEAVAVAAMQAGSQNYIVKSTITAEEVDRAIQLAIAHCAMEKRIHEQRLSLEIFTRALAHDLKEPVRTIKSFLAVLLAREALSPEGRRYFDYVHDAADRMASLIDAVYYYTRLDSSAQPAAREPCDIGAVLHDVQIDLTELIRERGAVIESAPLPVLSASVTQVRQVLQNLLSNAIRHCETDPIIKIEASEQKDAWEIRVSDNGPGIQEDLRTKVFEPFTRFAHHKVHGLGMGLAICKRIIETHGGKIWCEDAPRGGAIFAFTLPKDVALAPEEDPPALVPEQHVNGDGANGRHLAHVLVVDDNEAAIELTRIVLIEGAKLHCTLEGASSGEEALNLMRAALVQNNGMDLVLLDINMPRMDGFQLLDRMRGDEQLKSVPVVMCSTSGYDKDVERAKMLGAAGYVTKPATLTNLKPVLANVPSVTLCANGRGYDLCRSA
jgi:signal transduction histidine kinase